MNGRLRFGYCCVNSRLQKDGIGCFRTCRIGTLKEKGVDYVRELALQNVKDLAKIISWNEENGFTLFRVSSDMFPFASHPDHLYSLDFAQNDLKIAGDLAKQFGHRLTMHPSQHHVLTAQKESVLRNSVLGLEHQCEILDRMGMDKQSIMVIHGGGVYGDKAAALSRMEKNILELKPNVRDRLVLENDESSYSIEDLLPISKKLGIPVVVDFHHDALLPSSKPAADYLEEVFAVWDQRGIKPKVHMSQSEPGVTEKHSHIQRRKHGPYIDILPEAVLNSPRELDVMFEARMKEESIIYYMEKHGIKSLVKPLLPAEPLDAPVEAEKPEPEAKPSRSRKRARLV